MRLSTKEIEPGMVLAAPVLNRYGQILLGKGVTLTPRHVGILKTWGIPHITVEGGLSAGADPAEVNEEILAQARAQVRDRLLGRNHHLLEQEVFGLAVQQAAERLLEKQMRHGHSV